MMLGENPLTSMLLFYFQDYSSKHFRTFLATYLLTNLGICAILNLIILSDYNKIPDCTFAIASSAEKLGRSKTLGNADSQFMLSSYPCAIWYFFVFSQKEDFLWVTEAKCQSL